MVTYKRKSKKFHFLAGDYHSSSSHSSSSPSSHSSSSNIRNFSFTSARGFCVSVACLVWFKHFYSSSVVVSCKSSEEARAFRSIFLFQVASCLAQLARLSRDSAHLRGYFTVLAVKEATGSLWSAVMYAQHRFGVL